MTSVHMLPRKPAATHQIYFNNDPSAGSPTETLLRLYESEFDCRDGHGWGMDRVYPYPTRKVCPWMPEYHYPLVSIPEFYLDLLSMDIHTLPETQLFILNPKHFNLKTNQ